MLPPDAADLPVQAVLDELETLLARSDARSCAQLRGHSRQVSGQHTSTLLSRRNSYSTVLDRAAAGAGDGHSSSSHSGRHSALHSRQSLDWELTSCAECLSRTSSSRRRSSSHPGGQGSGGSGSRGSSSRGSEYGSVGDADSSDRFRRTVVDSTEVRDEIRQHLQMVRAL